MITSQTIDEFTASFCPWKYRDIEHALEMYDSAGKDYHDLVDAIQNYLTDFAMQAMRLEDLDICDISMNSLLEEARTDIKMQTGIDITNEDPYSHIYVSGNYMATRLDGTDRDMKALEMLIKKIAPLDRSEVTQWLLDEVMK